MGLYELDTWARENVCSDTAEREMVLKCNVINRDKKMASRKSASRRTKRSVKKTRKLRRGRKVQRGGATITTHTECGGNATEISAMQAKYKCDNCGKCFFNYTEGQEETPC